jgi:hypothetical protein
LFGSLSRKEPPGAALPPGDSFSLALAASRVQVEAQQKRDPDTGRLFDERPQRALDVCDQPGTKVPCRGHLPANDAEPQRDGRTSACVGTEALADRAASLVDTATAEPGTGEFAAIAALLQLAAHSAGAYSVVAHWGVAWSTLFTFAPSTSTSRRGFSCEAPPPSCGLRAPATELRSTPKGRVPNALTERSRRSRRQAAQNGTSRA